MIGEIAIEARAVTQATTPRDTFLQLIEQYEPALRRLACAYLDQAADREDLFQEIAVALWRATSKFRGESSRRTWLYRIAHNVAISYTARFNRRERRQETMPEPFDRPSAQADAEDELLQAEKLRLLHASIRDLAAIDRQIVLLHLEGLSCSEIEEVTGLSEAAVAAIPFECSIDG
jgi:RNA polymerase sigma-70 factor (ECF subfamily)